MKDERLAVLMTCHNRREMTLACLRKVKQQLPDSALIVDVYLVDDGSSDGTGEAVVEFWPEVRLLMGDGNLFWNHGMRKAFAEAMGEDYDYYLWLNDDTLLFPHSLRLLVNTANQAEDPGIVVGSTCDPHTQRTTYGGVVRPNGLRPLHFALLDPLDRPRPCESMNGNCVLIPRRVTQTVGNLDPCFTHTGGDLDYGLRARKAGFSVLIAPGYVGTCPRNPPEGSYHDRSLSPLERLNRMLHIKERPIREKRVFAQRHCGPLWPLYWLYPYLKVSVPSRTWLFAWIAGSFRKACGKGRSRGSMNPEEAPRRKKRIAVLHQGFIPVYRAGFFEEINRLGDFEFVIYHGSPPSNTGHRAYGGALGFPNRKIRNHEVRILGKSLIYQACVLDVLRGNYDGLILGQDLKFVSNLLLFSLFKLRRRPVALWGHGYSKEELSSARSGLFSQATDTIRTWLARKGDMYLVYTERGALELKGYGITPQKISVLRNTIDTREQDRLAAKYSAVNPEDLRRSLGLSPDSVVLLYVGRLYREKKVDELLLLDQQMNRRLPGRTKVEIVIIGDGPEFSALKAAGAGQPGVRFLGEVYDQDLIARYMRVTSAVVIPGKVGLAVVHAFSHGLPVITRDHRLHAPEIEYVEDGRNGLIVPGDFTSFVTAVENFVANKDLQTRLAEGARKSYGKLTMNYMVKSFNEAMIRMLG